MTVYNINHGIGWASSGVEYAQAYRSTVFRNRHIPAKFIFTDFFATDNLADLTRNMGFSDEDIIWLYGFFTDINVSPVTFSLSELEEEIPYPITKREVTSTGIRLYCEGQDIFYTVYFTHKSDTLVHRVELVSRGNLIRKDYYNYTKVFSEYYSPRDNKAYLYQRRFFNEDGSTAYDEIIDGDSHLFRFEKQLLHSKEELLAYMMIKLELTSQDIVILDRSTNTGQAVFRHVKPAKLGVVVHAEHYSKNQTTDTDILWNNFYDYQFTNADKVDFFITATDAQNHLLAEQFAKYTPHRPYIVTIPVGSIDQLRQAKMIVNPYKMLTASRLAMEKHVDWLVKATVAIHEEFPDVTLDIYGKGGEEGKLRTLIDDNKAQDYIHLCGHRDLTEVYENYSLYVTASKSEGFGLTLLEAIGAGLPIIGFDVPYGNQTFVKDGQNGYLIPPFEVDDEQIVKAYVDRLRRYFSEENQEDFHQRSYRIAENFLTSRVEEKWVQLVEEMTHD